MQWPYEFEQIFVLPESDSGDVQVLVRVLLPEEQCFEHLPDKPTSYYC